MIRIADLAAPEMRNAAGFHRNNTGLHLVEEGQNLIPSQLLAQNCPPEASAPCG